MWLVYREQTDGCRIQHGGNSREYRLPELSNLSVDGFCAETKTMYEFNGCYWHGHSCQPFRDVPTLAGDTLAERYVKDHGTAGSNYTSRVPTRSSMGM
jgi:hypothetical protein